MSADNYAICPRCLANAQTAAAKRFQIAVNAYGNVSAEEYERLRAEAQVPVSTDDFRTFREDYEFYGADEGIVTADYSGHCQTCGLGVDFKHERRFYPVEEEGT